MTGKRRNTGRLVADLRALVRGGDRQDLERHLRPAAPGVPVESQLGESRQREGNAGGGIASPLTEPDASARTYHSGVIDIVSTDGMIVMEIQGLATIDFEDGDGRQVTVVLDDPS